MDGLSATARQQHRSRSISLEQFARALAAMMSEAFALRALLSGDREAVIRPCTHAPPGQSDVVQRVLPSIDVSALLLDKLRDLSSEDVDLDAPLLGCGVDSRASLELLNSLRDDLGLALSPILTIDYPTARLLTSLSLIHI